MVLWNQIVRDKMPEILTEEGKLYRSIKLDDGKYMDALTKQLIKEAWDVSYHWKAKGVGNNDKMVEELSDVMEVVYSIAEKFKISKEELEETRLKKLEKMGGYINNTYITEVI